MSADLPAALDDEPISINLALPPDKLGAVIGPHGSTVNCIREESGASISVHKEPPPPFISVRGSAAAVMAAQTALEAIISPPSLTLRCPKERVGTIIGPRGATILQMQQQSGACISVESACDPCLITISGSVEALVAAQTALEAIISPPSLTLQCPKERVGAIIGPRGATIQQMQQQSGAHISVDSACDPCLITISGSVKALAAAQRLVEAVSDPPTVLIRCDPGRIGALIGPAGATIKAIEQRTGAAIDVPRTGGGGRAQAPANAGGECVVRVCGEPRALASAAAEVYSILCPPTQTVECEARRAPRLIGTGGETIQRLQAETGAHIRVETAGERCIIRVSASNEAATAAAAAVVHRWIHPASAVIAIPAAAVGALMGTDGANLAALRAPFGADATVDIATRAAAVAADREALVDVRIEATEEASVAALGARIAAEVEAWWRAQDYVGPRGALLRAEANRAALERSRLFGLAQAAYASGDGGGAAQLASEARAVGAQMAQLERAASVAILAHRNEGRGQREIDLHGLTVEEALGFLRERLEQLHAGRSGGPLRCIVGAGHHSPGQLARIKPAVHSLAKSLRLDCVPENEGAFLIQC